MGHGSIPGGHHGRFPPLSGHHVTQHPSSQLGRHQGSFGHGFSVAAAAAAAAAAAVAQLPGSPHEVNHGGIGSSDGRMSRRESGPNSYLSPSLHGLGPQCHEGSMAHSPSVSMPMYTPTVALSSSGPQERAPGHAGEMGLGSTVLSPDNHGYCGNMTSSMDSMTSEGCESPMFGQSNMLSQHSMYYSSPGGGMTDIMDETFHGSSIAALRRKALEHSVNMGNGCENITYR